MTNSEQSVGDSAETGSRVSRRTLLGSATILVGFAGCSDDGGGTGTTSAGESEPTATPETGDGTAEQLSPGSTEQMTSSTTERQTTATTTSGTDLSIESRCQVDNNTSEFAVVGCQSEADEGDLLVTLTLRNEGQANRNLNEYRIRARTYETAETSLENEITANYRIGYPNGREVGPGETIAVTVRLSLQGSNTPEDVEAYTFTLF